MPRIVGYIRVSTEGQADAGYSLAAQRHAITQYCAAHGWEVAAWYEDAGVSAHKETITARPAFATLLADAEAHQFDQVIVHKLDPATIG
jgi:site-specific DNA recombinase